MSALDDVIVYHAENCQSGSECDLSALSRSDLAQLRATVAEQARQLAAAREVITGYRGLPTGPKGYTSYPLFDLHNAADEWLAANPAPEAEQV